MLDLQNLDYKLETQIRDQMEAANLTLSVKFKKGSVFWNQKWIQWTIAAVSSKSQIRNLYSEHEVQALDCYKWHMIKTTSSRGMRTVAFYLVLLRVHLTACKLGLALGKS